MSATSTLGFKKDMLLLNNLFIITILELCRLKAIAHDFDSFRSAALLSMICSDTNLAQLAYTYKSSISLDVHLIALIERESIVR